mgnify:FL=1
MAAALKYKQGKTPMGYLLIATDEDALVYAEFGENPDTLLGQFQSEHPEESQSVTTDPLLNYAWDAYSNYLLRPDGLKDIPVRMGGTEFQRQVWSALQRMPAGSRQTYSDLAVSIGQPTAVRAVASACARNSIALRIPCHRILRSDGGLGGYRWGLALKRRLLSTERKIYGTKPSAAEPSNPAVAD